MSEQNTSVIQFQELPAIAANAPEIFAFNANLVSRANNKGQTLLDTIEGGEMTPELDMECNEYLLNVAKAIKNMNDGRSPLTRMLTAINGEFTGLENQLDKTKLHTIPAKVQEARNQFAKQVAQNQQRRQQELVKKQKADQERIDIVTKVQLTVREKYNKVLYDFKTKFNNIFNAVMLDTVPDVTDQINKMPEFYPQSKFNEIAIPITAIYIDAAELPGLIYDSRAALYPELSEHFKNEMAALRHHLLDQIPARKQELLEIKEAEKKNQATADKLRRDAEIRQQEAQLQLEKENQAREKAAQAEAQTTQQVGAAQLAFEHDMGQADIFADQTAVVKHGYVIKVMTNIGWMQIINLWFKEFGSKTTPDKVATKKPESMKADLEKLAYNGGTRLDNSGHLVYEQDVKAVTKKV